MAAGNDPPSIRPRGPKRRYIISRKSPLPKQVSCERLSLHVNVWTERHSDFVAAFPAYSRTLTMLLDTTRSDHQDEDETSVGLGTPPGASRAIAATPVETSVKRELLVDISCGQALLTRFGHVSPHFRIVPVDLVRHLGRSHSAVLARATAIAARPRVRRLLTVASRQSSWQTASTACHECLRGHFGPFPGYGRRLNQPSYEGNVEWDCARDGSRS